MRVGAAFVTSRSLRFSDRFTFTKAAASTSGVMRTSPAPRRCRWPPGTELTGLGTRYRGVGPSLRRNRRLGCTPQFVDTMGLSEYPGELVP